MSNKYEARIERSLAAEVARVKRLKASLKEIAERTERVNRSIAINTSTKRICRGLGAIAREALEGTA